MLKRLFGIFQVRPRNPEFSEVAADCAGELGFKAPLTEPSLVPILLGLNFITQMEKDENVYTCVPQRPPCRWVLWLTCTCPAAGNQKLGGHENCRLLAEDQPLPQNVLEKSGIRWGWARRRLQARACGSVGLEQVVGPVSLPLFPVR